MKCGSIESRIIFVLPVVDSRLHEKLNCLIVLILTDTDFYTSMVIILCISGFSCLNININIKNLLIVGKRN